MVEAYKEAGASVIEQIQKLAPGRSSRPVQQKIPRKLLKNYPRSVHPQFLARLDENRQVLAQPTGMSGSIPTDSLNQDDLWQTALYYAIKPTSRDYSYLPPVSEITDANFGALTYKVDSATGTTEILPAAFEDEPYTGQVIIDNKNGTRQLVAFIKNGRLTELGTLWDLNGTQMLAQNHYDELGFVAQAMVWDTDGTLMAQSPPADGKKSLKKGEILVTQSEVRGEFIYERANDAKIASLTGQIEAATDPDEKTRLEGELLDLQLAAGTPFSGTVVEFWDEERTQKKREEPVQVGKHNGTAIWWYANGTKQFEAEYLKGVPQGRTAWYREDGSLEYEGFWENDKLLRATTWDATNQKTGDVTAGNGTLIYFHPNGQRRLEETFANGDLTATKWWDEEGNEVESASPSFIPAPPKLD
jgi:antitoxin component YwqK of YwqJK toxin-antitoxin module